jgi:GNAT superfamily N-acetyltransferase
MELLDFRLALINESSAVISLYSKCKQSLLHQNILQWGDWSDNYPNAAYLEKSISNHELFIVALNDRIIGAVILNEIQSPEWRALSWLEDRGKPLIIHALIIDPNQQSKGFGKRLLWFCEECAQSHNYSSIRLDAFSKNRVSNQLYQNRGYNPIGTVIFDKKPLGNKEYICYEKVF